MSRRFTRRWLQVTPQLIARMHNPHHRIRQAVLRLLARMAQAHPQGLIYPLAVAAKSQIGLQKSGATQVLDQMRAAEDTLVAQAELVRHAPLDPSPLVVTPSAPLAEGPAHTDGR